MSWSSYIDNFISQADGNIDRLGIFGLDGGYPWTPNYPKAIKPSLAEMNIISAEMNNGGDYFRKTGYIQIEKIKYKLLRSAEGEVLAKLKGKGSIVMQKSKTAIVIAHCPEGKKDGNAVKAVNTLVEYLESMNMDESVVTNRAAGVILADILDMEFRKRREIGVENGVAGDSKPAGNSIAQPSIAHHNNTAADHATGMSKAGLTAALICPIVLLLIFVLVLFVWIMKRRKRSKNGKGNKVDQDLRKEERISQAGRSEHNA